MALNVWHKSDLEWTLAKIKIWGGDFKKIHPIILKLMIYGQVSFPDERCANKFLCLYKIRYFKRFCYIILEFQYIGNSAFANSKNPWPVYWCKLFGRLWPWNSGYNKTDFKINLEILEDIFLAISLRLNRLWLSRWIKWMKISRVVISKSQKIQQC